ncbi:15531_t:CDS:2 [Dentiscutata heterogama]|uniref:15531_t:CDS:1 n=1 Tax=Dentiscutata heterogama TaxID=1316150 RepID=A0ACA9KU62_9GLOM|nr:15531_t:CDS:2 [Dentiscutata heterogama]
MVQLRSHPQVFKAIKIFQWFMTLTILILGYYLSQFHKQWGQGPNIMIELGFFIIWLIAVYTGFNLSCTNEESHDQCVYFSVSLIMGWMNTIAFLITTIVCKKIQWEKVKWGKERSGFTKEQQKEFFNQSVTNPDKLNQTNNDSISINSRQITTPNSLKTTPKPLKISPEIANVNGGNMKSQHRRQESELYPEEPSTPVVCQQLIPQQHYHPDQRQEYDMDMEHSQHPAYSYRPENDQYEGYP